jgi:hypothetical protein
MCGRRANSRREDVLALWIREQLGDVGQAKRFARIQLPADVQPGDVYEGEWEDALIMAARWKVCTPCNNEWMSQFQQTAKPILGPMIDGRPADLSPTQQGIIARWASMTAITAEYAHGQTVEEFRRRWLFEHQEAPPNTWVFLLDARTFLKTAFCGLRRQEISKPENVHNYVMFLSIRDLGFLVIQGAVDLRQRRVIEKHHRRLISAWPIMLESRHWPPPEPMTPNLAIEVAYELLGETAPAASQGAVQAEALAEELDAEE